MFCKKPAQKKVAYKKRNSFMPHSNILENFKESPLKLMWPISAQISYFYQK